MGHSVSNAVTGPKHRTKDEHFNEITHKFEEQRKRLEALQKDVSGFLASAEAMLSAIESVALASLALTTGPGPLKILCEAEIQTVKRIREDKKNHLEPQMHDQFVRPLQGYLTQYKELHGRVAERNKRKDEMDKLKEKRDKLQEKNDAKGNEIVPKYDVAKQSYEDLNDELIKDMPLLVEDSEKFFAPLVALFIVNKSHFLQAMNNHSVEESHQLDLSNAHVPQVSEVITQKNNSAMTRQYQAHASSYSNPPPADHNSGYPSTSPRPTMSTSPRTSGYGTAPQPQGAQPYGQPQPTQGGPSPRSSGLAPPHVPERRTSNPPVPPPRIPQARALWDFNGQAGELSFRAGEIITVLSREGDWWQGEIVGRGHGKFPGNYVQML